MLRILEVKLMIHGNQAEKGQKLRFMIPERDSTLVNIPFQQSKKRRETTLLVNFFQIYVQESVYEVTMSVSNDPSLLHRYRGLSDSITHVAFHPKENQVSPPPSRFYSYSICSL